MAAIDNLTAILYKKEDLRLEQKPIPEIQDDEVLIKMACVGICGSDVHYLVHGRIADYVVDSPMIIGHEASGTVVKTGKDVSNLKEGDRVAIEPGVSCRKCRICKEGRYNLCAGMRFCATPPYDGNLCRYYAHAADFCYKIPDSVSFEEAALIEPLSVGMHACRRGKLQIGDTVLVIGAGPIGLVTLICAKAMGARRVIITDLLDFKLEVAKELGADHTLLVKPSDDEKEVTKKIQEILEGNLPDITIDCSGFESTIKLGLQATRNGGTLVLVGMGAQEVKLPLLAAMCREVDIKGVFRYANDYPVVLSMISSGKLNLKKLITHKFNLEETLEAFNTARTGKGNPIKVMIYCDKNLNR
ncbi:sorbitol dehydrogenase-like isoform X2 [Nilaparvata lugens]|uniref:sorbitol dehydrogenase-like isoform X1 n=1 Tax=Nilaparvata lugens TaxID=108931 RepID=UPI000B98F4FF|nr:sorbitol dehydrogenase-like isoform X1 [Nilaparvata lugens]XP_039275522.1 sorbitol dehydrogenase-like isoform X2 [Nilaparvata lugens]